MRKFVAKIWGNEFYQGGIFFTVASLMVNLLNYVFNMIIGRTLGPQGYGEISTLFSYVTLSSIPVLVVSALIIQKLGSAEKSLETAKAIEHWVWLKSKKIWWLFALILLVTPFVPRITNLSYISGYTLVPLVFLTLASSYYVAMTQGLKLFKAAAFISILAVLVKLIGALFVILHVDGLLTVCIFLMLSVTYTLLASRRAIPKLSSVHEAIISEKRLRSVLSSKTTILTTLSIIGMTVLSNLDIILVKKFYPATEAGLYSSWALFAKIILYFVNPLIAVSFVYFAQRKGQNNQEKALKYALICLSLIGILSYIGYTFFGTFVIGLVFGQKFNAVEPYLYLASIFGSLYTALVFLNNYFLARRSSVAYILPACLPIYFVMLYLSRTHLVDVMRVNIYFTLCVNVIYVSAYIYSLRTATKQ